MIPKRRFRTIFLIAIMIFSTVLPAVAGASDLAANSDKVDVIIAFHHQPGSNEQALVKAFGGTVKFTYHIVPAIAASIPQAAVEGISKNPQVALIEPDVEIHALGETTPWGIDRIDADIVQTAGNKGDGVKVAVIDSGVDYTHPDLSGNYAGGYDFVNNDSYPLDDNGHGTHVAGTIAAIAGNNQGVLGVAPKASIYALKVLDRRGSGSFSNVIAALDWCVANGIQITNNSYGSSGDPGQTVRNAFDNAYEKGILNVAAAGNEGNSAGTGDSVGYPAKYESVIAVAATDSSDVRAYFSSTGPKVELSAPGVSILSTIPGNSYATYSGTSMASPHVAGVAALVINSSITGPGNIRSKLQTTADGLGSASLYGYGLVDADEAAGVGNPPPPNTAPTITIVNPVDGSSFQSGITIAFTGSADDTQDGVLTESMDWTSDKDGSIGKGGSFSAVLSDGTHTITSSVTDRGGMKSSASITITVGSIPDYKPDLTFTALSAPTKGTIGRSININTTVKNIGNVNASNFVISYYLSTDQNIGSDIRLGTKTISNLAAGALTTTNAKVTITISTVQGSYWVLAIIDETGQISESDESNNFICAANQTLISKR